MDRELVAEDEILPFTNLISFECCASFCDHHIPNALRLSPHLKCLSLSTCIQPDFPDLSMFDKLETLRIFFSDLPHLPMVSRPKATLALIPSHTLTTFTLFANPTELEASTWVKAQISRLVFPKLRVTKLEALPYPPRIYYDFVQRHPTLREVTLNFYVSPDASTLLPHLHGLINLLEGTWIPADEHAYSPFMAMDDPTVQLNRMEPTFLQDPARLTTFKAFSFARSPHNPDTTSFSSYFTTAFCLDMLHSPADEHMEWSISLPRVLRMISSNFSQVTELELRNRTIHDMLMRSACYNFEDEMVRGLIHAICNLLTCAQSSIAVELRPYTRLRKLALEWRINPEEWRWNEHDHPNDLVVDSFRRVNSLIFTQFEQPKPSTPTELIASEYFIGDE